MIDAGFIAQIENVLARYAEELQPRFPVICFDEALKHLIGEGKVPRPVQPG